MGKSKQIACPACGHKNDANLDRGRCGSCGSPLALPAQAAGYSVPSSFSMLWVLVGAGVSGILTAAFVVGLPMVIHAVDFEGSAGMMVALPVWFGSGILVGLISPDKTYAEPAAATALVAVPTVAFLINSQTVKTMPLFLYILLAGLGVLFAMIGAYTGEKLQARAG